MIPANLTEKVTIRGDCWIFTGCLNSRGYGCIQHEGRVQLAHRVAYETAIGPIPGGLTIDHLCMVKSCVNPAHLEPVTLAENLRRSRANGRAAPPLSARNAAKAQCRHGHDFDQVNTYTTPEGHRVCRTCKRASDNRRAARLRRSA